jgi:hypothetical protein
MDQKTGQQISKELGITRQAVAQTVKRALGKIYKSYAAEYPWLSPFELVARIMLDFDIEFTHKNFNTFPPRIKRIVIEAGKKYAEERNYLLPLYK